MSNDWLPDVHFGSASNPLPKPDQDDDSDPDDEELKETPPDVVMMLGFDPATNADFTGDDSMTDAARKDADAKLDAILAGMAGIASRLDSVETDIKARKDAEEKQSRFDLARKDRFGPRKDGESRKDYMKRHDDDEMAMMDALKDDADAEMRVKDCRKDAEAEEAKKDEDFEKWAKEESEEPAHRDDGAKKDAEERAAKDAAEMERKVSMMNQARKDAVVNVENADLKARLAAMENAMRGLTTETPAADRDAMARAQSRADSVAAMFGDRAAAPYPGEKPLDYRKRLAEKFKKHSRLKDSRFDSLDEISLSPLEDIVYADAVTAARNPVTAVPGRLIPHVERVGGRDLTTFTGDPMAWMAPFMTGSQTGTFIRSNTNRG